MTAINVQTGGFDGRSCPSGRSYWGPSDDSSKGWDLVPRNARDSCKPSTKTMSISPPWKENDLLFHMLILVCEDILRIRLTCKPEEDNRRSCFPLKISFLKYSHMQHGHLVNHSKRYISFNFAGQCNAFYDTDRKYLKTFSGRSSSREHI